MNVSCPECRSVFRVDPARVSSAGVRARCSICGAVMTVGVGDSIDEEFAQSRSPSVAAAVAQTPAANPAVVASPSRPAPFPPRPIVAPPQGASRTATTTPARGGFAIRPTMPPMPAIPPARPMPPIRPTTAPSMPAVPAPAQSAPAQVAAIQPAPMQPGPMQPAPMQAAPPARPATQPSPAPAAGPTPARAPINPFLANDPNAKARRLSRALISDLVTYFPQRRDEGLRDGTLKELFREEIKKSYEEYVDQVGRDFADSTTHFQEALNEILAGGQKMF